MPIFEVGCLFLRLDAYFLRLDAYFFYYYQLLHNAHHCRSEPQNSKTLKTCRSCSISKKLCIINLFTVLSTGSGEMNLKGSVVNENNTKYLVF